MGKTQQSVPTSSAMWGGLRSLDGRKHKAAIGLFTWFWKQLGQASSLYTFLSLKLLSITQKTTASPNTVLMALHCRFT